MALVVEDGTGKTTAESYISVTDADTYISDFMRDDASWTALATIAKEGYLREAAQALDLIFANRWVGSRASEAQALAFPRIGIRDGDGYVIASTTVPIALKGATVEMAWRSLSVGGIDTTTGDSTLLIPDSVAGSNIASESVKAGSVSTTTTYSGGKTSNKRFKKVEMMLAGLIKARGAIERA